MFPKIFQNTYKAEYQVITSENMLDFLIKYIH